MTRRRISSPISLYASLPNIVCVSAKLPVKNLSEFVDYAKKNPKVPYSSVGNGSSQHLAGELFAQLAGAQMQHVPYRVTTQLQADLLSGAVPASFQLLPNVIGGIKSGQIRALAVREQGPSRLLCPKCLRPPKLASAPSSRQAWFGFLAPKRHPSGDSRTG
jgi:tripartite-type tricarboxylate transporter receptor subunit TctC